MPVFLVRQTVSHPAIPKKVVKETHISGNDLGHAIDCVRCPEPMKKDLRKKYWSRSTEPNGRTLYIEIIKEKKSK